MSEEKRKGYAEVRTELLKYFRRDLEGPYEKEELLDENPRSSYITGMLAPAGFAGKDDFDEESEQEIAVDTANDSNEYTSSFSEESEDRDAVSVTNFRLQSSIGLSFYVSSDVKEINAEVSWGDYSTEKGTYTDSEGIEHEKQNYRRIDRKDSLRINIAEARKGREWPLSIDSNVHIYATCMDLCSGYSLVTVYAVNRRPGKMSSVSSIMFQAQLAVTSVNGEKIFRAEAMCRGNQASKREDFYYCKRPIYAHGRGCAALWDTESIDGVSRIETSFIPEYEIPGVSSEIEGFGRDFFSTRSMSIAENREKALSSLEALADAYEKWIDTALRDRPEMENEGFRENIGNPVISDCMKSLKRIRKGIEYLRSDETAFKAFCFMNLVIYMQNLIKGFSGNYKKGNPLKWSEYRDKNKLKAVFCWRPFQIAFILMNLKGISDPLDEDRENVDLLYFPTGGGKTEAYLGLMAYTIGDRRLRRNLVDDGFERDGGVTVILRYTLRLLTTQQRDRILRMIIAAENIRSRNEELYGSEPISLGFWVGGQVTPNRFNDEDIPDSGIEKKILKQIPVCPFCGKPLSAEYIFADMKRKEVRIYCSADKGYCMYSHENEGENPPSIPIHMIDEEIYAKCPTVLLGTVDKFAQLPWRGETDAIFGRVDRKCTRDGYVVNGLKHERHKKECGYPASELISVKPFLPPELIIQDELHLITGPLGTIYGAYETMIDELSSYDAGGHRVRPKYISSTATIKNAGEQIKMLYGRERYSQFPPSGFEEGDSFFVNELSLDEYPFRKYIGISAPGSSMKTVLLRVYAIILQAAYDLLKTDEYKDYIDPYYTLIGYFNSIRELGGTVRLLQDDIVKRIRRIKTRLGDPRERYIQYGNIEITSRMGTGEIPKLLQKLENSVGDKDCIDTALATNMIAVGLDVDRLGLMVVTGQPKQTSEYIQSTSRVGRKYPGLVATIYNPYRPRDFSHYENFMGYHAELNKYVEGTTATPFSERARDRVLCTLIITAIRLAYPEMIENNEAGVIQSLDDEKIEAVKDSILKRLKIVKPEAITAASDEIDEFIAFWKKRAKANGGQLYYYITGKYYKKNNRLMNMYGSDPVSDYEKSTLNSMRDVEKSSSMYYWEG